MNEDSEIEQFAPWAVVFITLAGGLLRVFTLANKGMWLDETFSVWLANHSVGEMLQWIVRIDQHPPLYYLLLHYWIGLNGDTPYYVRMLSALFGTATIPIIYLIGKRISGVVMGLVAALLLALSLFNIYFAQETRMYTLMTFNAAVAMYALVRLLTDSRAVRPIGSQFREYLHAWRTLGPLEPDTEKEFSYKESRKPTGLAAWIASHRWSPIRTIETDLAWVAYIVFTAATMLSHNTAVLFPVAANIFVLGLMLYQRNKKPVTLPSLQAPSFTNWVKAQIAIFLLWSPWLVAFIRQAGAVDQRFWIPQPTWDGVVQVLKTLMNPSAPLPDYLASAIWALYFLALGLALLHFRKKIPQYVISGCLLCHPLPRRADREHPPANFLRSNPALDNHPIVPGTGSGHRSTKVSPSHLLGGGDFGDE